MHPKVATLVSRVGEAAIYTLITTVFTTVVVGILVHAPYGFGPFMWGLAVVVGVSLLVLFRKWSLGVGLVLAAVVFLTTGVSLATLLWFCVVAVAGGGFALWARGWGKSLSEAV